MGATDDVHAWEDVGIDDMGQPDGTNGTSAGEYSGATSGTGVEEQLWGPFIPDTHRMVVVTSNGVFRRRIRWCRCPDKADSHLQLLRLNLFSATIERPATAFTFELLDHFHIDAMECKTAAMNFFAKLRRITNNAFPAAVPVGNEI
jgi:hypothetical protein